MSKRVIGIGQRLIPGLIVALVVAASLLFRPAGLASINVLSACSYGYLGAPTVTGINPTSGSTFGGTVVVITGCGFTGVTAVHFGVPAGTSVIVNNDSTIHATSPAQAAGTVNVDVTKPAGTSAHTAADMFTYGAAPCTGVTTTVGGSGPITSAQAGTIIPINAIASGCTNPLYQFWIMNPGGSWTIAQPYSARSNFNWDTRGPEAAGTYFYSVWVRDASSSGTSCGSLGCNDAFKPGTAFPLTTTPCASVTATALPATPQAQGTVVTITGTAVGCGSPLYQFWLLAPGSSTWQIAKAFSPSNAFSWTTTLINGTYRWSVWARDSSSQGTSTSSLGSFDTFAPGTLYTLS